MPVFRQIILFLALFLPIGIFAQPVSQDRLLEDAQHEKNVLKKLSSLNEYCYGYRRTNRDKGLRLANLLYQSSQKLRYPEGIADYYFLKGTFSFPSEPDSAIFFLRKAVSQYALINIDELKFSRALNNLASVYQYNVEYDSSLKYSLLANRIILHQDIPKNPTYEYRLAINYKSIADAYCFKSILDSSTINYERAEYFARRVNDSNALAIALQNKANILNINEQYSEAAQILLEVIPIHKALENYPELIGTYASTGNYFAYAKQNDKALAYIDSSMKMATVHDIDRYLPYNYQGLGTIYMNQKSYFKAFNSFKKGLEIAREIENYFAEKSLLLGSGESALALMQYNQAISFFQEALMVKDQYREHTMQAYRGLAQAYERIGENENAIKFNKLYYDLKDSIYSLKKNLIINQVTQNDFLRKQQKTIQQLEIEKKQQEIERNQEFTQKIIAFSLVGLIFIIVYFYVKYYRLKKEKEKEALIIHERLRISRDLHDDLGATISSINIYSSTVKQKLHENNIEETERILDKISEEAQDMVYGMSDMVWTISPQNDTIEKLINRVHNYGTDIMQAKDIQFKLNYDEQVGKIKLSMEQRRNIFLILKEAINNLVKYSNTNSALLSAYFNHQKICIKLEDNGIGFDLTKHNSSPNSGNGIKNIAQRAHEIQAECLIESCIGKGTTIQILLNPPKKGGIGIE